MDTHETTTGAEIIPQCALPVCHDKTGVWGRLKTSTVQGAMPAAP
jgi:hypothetical protein